MTESMQQKMAQWKAIRTKADKLEAEILAEATQRLTEGFAQPGDQVEWAGAKLHYSPGRGCYDYQAAVKACPLPPSLVGGVISLNTKPVTDWRSVWTGLGQASEGLTPFYTPGQPTVKLVLA